MNETANLISGLVLAAVTGFPLPLQRDRSVISRQHRNFPISSDMYGSTEV